MLIPMPPVCPVGKCGSGNAECESILKKGIICDFQDITTKGAKNAKSSERLLIFVSFACFVVFYFRL